MYVCMFVGMYTHMHVCMYAFIHEYAYGRNPDARAQLHECRNVCTYMCTCAYLYVFMYGCVCMNACIYSKNSQKSARYRISYT